jgi:hypothetical protein
VLASVKELAALFGMATAMMGFCGGPPARSVVGRVVAAQLVLTARMLLTWRMLSKPWGDAAAAQYARAAALAQITFPLLTLGVASFVHQHRSGAEEALHREHAGSIGG